MSRQILARTVLFAGELLVAVGLLAALVLSTAAPAFAADGQSGDRFCAGRTMTIPSGTSIDGLIAFGCNVTIEQGATVRGDITDFGGNFNIAGTVNGNILTFGGNVSLESSAVVHGDLAPVGGNIRQAPGATVTGRNAGQSGALIPPQPPIAPLAAGPFARGFNILGGIISALAFAALGALVVIFAPNATRRVSEAAQAKPLNTAGVGCLTLILVPILGVLLIFTLVGIPVTILLGILLPAAWVFGGIGVGLLAGDKILQAFKARDVVPAVAVIVGVIVLIVAEQIPFLGPLIWVVVGLIGLGAVVLTRFGTRTYPQPPGILLSPAFSTPGPGPGAGYTPGSMMMPIGETRVTPSPTQTTVSPATVITPQEPSAEMISVPATGETNAETQAQAPNDTPGGNAV